MLLMFRCPLTRQPLSTQSNALQKKWGLQTHPSQHRVPQSSTWVRGSLPRAPGCSRSAGIIFHKQTFWMSVHRTSWQRGVCVFLRSTGTKEVRLISLCWTWSQWSPGENRESQVHVQCQLWWASCFIIDNREFTANNPLSVTFDGKEFANKEASQDLELVLSLEMILDTEECEGLFIIARTAIPVWPKEALQTRDLIKPRRMWELVLKRYFDSKYFPF